MQLFWDILQNRRSEKFYNIHWKTTVLQSLFNKVADLKSLVDTKLLVCIFFKEKQINM